MKRTFMHYETKVSQLATELNSLTEVVRNHAETISGDIPLPPLLRQNLVFGIDHIISYVQGMRNLIKANLIHEEEEHILLIKSKIDEYIRENYQNKIPLTVICSYVGVSKSIFCNLFQRYYGCTFISDLNKYRIELAVQQLKTSGESIADVAYGCGFDCLNWFNVKFKENTGMTPGEYRNQNNNYSQN